MKAIIPSIFLTTVAATTLGTSPEAYQAVLVGTQDTDCPNITDPSADQLESAIVQWRQDVTAVNAFLDRASYFIYHAPQSVLLQNANWAYGNASDEPCQFDVLKANQFTVPDNDAMAFTCAIKNLTAVFGTVLGNLSLIINNSLDTSIAIDAVSAINHVRCCAVLPDLDALWLATKDSANLNDISPLAPRPYACSQFECDPTTPCPRAVPLAWRQDINMEL